MSGRKETSRVGRERTNGAQGNGTHLAEAFSDLPQSPTICRRNADASAVDHNTAGLQVAGERPLARNEEGGQRRDAGRASLRNGGGGGRALKTGLNAGGRRENGVVRYEKVRRACVVMKCAIPGWADKDAPKESMELLIALTESIEWLRVPCGRTRVRLAQGELSKAPAFD
jgi:hypothetical protein